ncbi:unnamed protein product [Symbiodinium sp. CCMP2592]|nr:unnamed protein product [Symbiodinium sp. CCMP2592]CAE7545125.1 unnamed protein product [Symbiodinium sp. CCMP2592]
MFSALYENYHEAFKRYVVADANVLQEFWRLQKKHPQFNDHPVVSQASFEPRKFVPLSLHGDGTPAIGVGKIWSRMLTTWSWCSLVGGPAWTKDSQLPIYFLFDETDDGTAATTFLSMLAWSFKVLQEGLWPFADHKGNLYPPTSDLGRKAGSPLAGGWKGVIWALVGDLEYMVSRLNMPHFGQKHNPCGLCKCSGDETSTSWRNCKPTAPWLSMQWSLAEWRSFPDRPKNPLFDSGVCSALSCHMDYMHTKYLGLDPLGFGSVLSLLVNFVLPDSPLANLRCVWEHLLSSYKALKIVERFRGMRKLSLFQRKKLPPKLKGRAMQIQALGEPLLLCWQNFMNKDLEIHLKIENYLKVNLALEKILHATRTEMAMPPDHAEKFKKLAFGLCQLHRQLREHFEGNYFADLPKMHFFLHACLLADVLHPRLTWCFKGEDLQKISRTLAGSCCRAVTGPRAAAKMSQQLRIAWHLRLDRLCGE